MSTIITIAAGDNISDSRTDINTNFTNLNSDKIETSVLDTDTTLAANSDSKVATQKAVKTYIDTSGGANASTTVRGIVEEATAAEIAAATAAGGTGARLFINPSTLPVIDYQVFTASGTWTKPSIAGSNALVVVEAWGAGGGGGSGDNTNSRAGGGGGGVYITKVFKASSLGATETVTIGTGGAAGTVGGNTTLGSLLTAYGGGAGATQSGAGASGGGGGAGGLSVGSDASGATGGAGGSPAGSVANTANSGYGGAGGGTNAGAGGVNAGASAFGGGGGGSAASAGSASNGGNGGASIYGGGGGGGACSTSAETPGTGGASMFAGAGGAGADGTGTGTAGSAPGGGGGGAGGSSTGGSGARGEMRIWTIVS